MFSSIYLKRLDRLFNAMDGSRGATGAPIKRSGPPIDGCDVAGSTLGSGDGDQSEFELELPGEFLDLNMCVEGKNHILIKQIETAPKSLTPSYTMTEVFDRTVLVATQSIHCTCSRVSLAGTAHTNPSTHRVTQLFRLRSAYVGC